jgi:hypothetical protein
MLADEWPQPVLLYSLEGFAKAARPRRSGMGIFEGFRRWLDGEDAPGADGQPKPRSKWEDFMVAIAREVEAVMQREMFTPPGGPTYIPREYVVFLSADDDAEWQGEKREGLERGLHYVLGKRASELAGTTEFQTRSFTIELRTDPTLEKGQFRVQPVWDASADRTTVKPRRSPAANVPMTPTSTPAEPEEDSTVVRPRTKSAPAAAPLFSVSIERDVPGPKAPPDVREFFKTKITIGRGSKQMAVDLRLEGDLEVSRHHATLEQQGEQFLVTCEGLNSIFVDSTEVLTGETAVVRPGQRVAVCSYLLTPQAVAAETVSYNRPG